MLIAKFHISSQFCAGLKFSFHWMTLAFCKLKMYPCVFVFLHDVTVDVYCQYFYKSIIIRHVASVVVIPYYSRLASKVITSYDTSSLEFQIH
jgi:hypothetical protein